MKGFKNTTKTVSGHHFASGGIVPGMGHAPKTSAAMVRPVLPRPHVMPSGSGAKMRPMTKLARGGSFGKSDGAGGPYNPPGGNTLEMNNRPYSKIEQDHPRNSARPGYAKGGKLRSMKKVAKKEVAKHVAAKPPQGHGVKPRGGLAFSRAPLCGGGKV